LSLALLLELVGVLRRVSAESGVRAIVIEGSRAGVLGRAPPRRDDRPRRAFLRWLFDDCTELMGTIHRLPEPVIAQVERTPTGAGCRLVACDLRVAAERAWFATPGVKILERREPRRRDR
jgi:enoyl-CoA hydratase/carnithine racemase